MLERREAGDIFRFKSAPFQAEVFECTFQINGVPKSNYVDDKPKGTELVFLPFTIALSKLAPLSMKASASNTVSAFLSI